MDEGREGEKEDNNEKWKPVHRRALEPGKGRVRAAGQ